MTLIKMNFLKALSTLQSDVSTRLASAMSGGKAAPPSSSLSETALHALLYSKFRAVSQTVKTLLFELQKRAQAYPQEYGNLLQECFTNWFSLRTQLLAPNLAEEVRRMDPANTELVKLVSADIRILPSFND